MLLIFGKTTGAYGSYSRILNITEMAHQLLKEKVIKIPYMFLQLRLEHNKEYKLIVLNGKAKMIVNTKDEQGQSDV